MHTPLQKAGRAVTPANGHTISIRARIARETLHTSLYRPYIRRRSAAKWPIDECFSFVCKIFVIKMYFYRHLVTFSTNRKRSRNGSHSALGKKKSARNRPFTDPPLARPCPPSTIRTPNAYPQNAPYANFYPRMRFFELCELRLSSTRNRAKAHPMQDAAKIQKLIRLCESGTKKPAASCCSRVAIDDRPINNWSFSVRNRLAHAGMPGIFSALRRPRIHSRNCGIATRFCRRV